jgi:hypothetical protein
MVAYLLRDATTAVQAAGPMPGECQLLSNRRAVQPTAGRPHR